MHLHIYIYIYIYIYIHWHFVAAFVFPPLGPTPPESCRAFLYQSLVRRTPLHEQTHGVVLKITSGIREYSLDCVQKLRRGELDAVLDVLRELFDQSRPLPHTTAVWSAAATAAGHYVGLVYVARGGHSGRGELAVDVERHAHGIFSLP